MANTFVPPRVEALALCMTVTTLPTILLRWEVAEMEAYLYRTAASFYCLHTTMAVHLECLRWP